MSRRAKAIVLAAALAALTAAALLLPVRAWLVDGIAWIQTQGPLAWVVFVLVYILAAVLLVPGSILTLAAGFVFGLPLGVALVSAGSVLGAAAAFLVGRFFARDWVRARISELPRFRALDSAARHDGFVIVLLARLSPLFPFNLLNYGLGITGVRFKDYFFGSWIGMLPATVLYVYVGTLAGDVTELSAESLRGSWLSRAFLAAGFVATLALTIVITRKATQALKIHLSAETSVERGSDGRTA
jgi:uncharacterized membrane protein YdjX (TVP38/TMEM64 family)